MVNGFYEHNILQTEMNIISSLYHFQRRLVLYFRPNKSKRVGLKGARFLK